MAHSVEHGLELVPADEAVAVLVDLPDHVLHVRPLALVLQLLQRLRQLVRAHLRLILLAQPGARLLVGEDLEDALQILELLRLVVLRSILLAAAAAPASRTAHGCTEALLRCTSDSKTNRLG